MFIQNKLKKWLSTCAIILFVTNTSALAGPIENSLRNNTSLLERSYASDEMLDKGMIPVVEVQMQGTFLTGTPTVSGDAQAVVRDLKDVGLDSGQVANIVSKDTNNYSKREIITAMAYAGFAANDITSALVNLGFAEDIVKAEVNGAFISTSAAQGTASDTNKSVSPQAVSLALPTVKTVSTTTEPTSKAALIKQIEETYGVKIVEKPGYEFSIEELQNIQSILEDLPADLIDGFVLQKENMAPGVLGYFKVDPETGEKIISVSSLINDPELFQSVVIHELAHAIDYKYHGMSAFEELYNQSTSPEDFAREYGRTNAQEDFATVIEALGSDSKAEFLRGIEQAANGKPIYLKKLVLALDALSEGHPEYVMLYQVGGNGTLQKVQVDLQRDASGAITAIGGVGINGLNALKGFFNNLSFS